MAVDDVTMWPGGHMQLQGVAQAHYLHMNLGAEATLTATQRLLTLTTAFL